jgi:histidyl-tRNA synthetase
MQAIRGTRDILPTEVGYWQFVEKTASTILQRALYQEIRTPIFENTFLFERGIGEATDVVGKEMYTFLDRGDRSLTLRPEGTAGVARAYINYRPPAAFNVSGTKGRCSDTNVPRPAVSVSFINSE